MSNFLQKKQNILHINRKYLIMTGEEIKNNREKLGYTQEKLAELLGVSRQTIINYENGKVIPENKN